MKVRLSVLASLITLALLGTFVVQVGPVLASSRVPSWVDPCPGCTNWSDVGVSPDGTRVYVTGRSPSDTHADYLTVAYDAVTGAQLWAARYDDPWHLGDAPYILRVSPNGARVYVTGDSRRAPGPGGLDWATIAYDARTGSQLWVARYEDPRHSVYAGPMSVSPDSSRVFVAGGSRHPNSSRLIAYNAATGKQLWNQAFPGIGPPFAQPSLAVTPDDSTVLAAEPGGPSYVLVAYSAATGEVLWERQENLGDLVTISPDGSTADVMGWGDNGLKHGTYDIAGGHLVSHWVTHVFGKYARGQLAVSPDGSRIYAASLHRAPNLQDQGYLRVAAIDASTGNAVWISQHHHPLAVWVDGIVPAPDGNRVYVACDTTSSITSPVEVKLFGYDTATGLADWKASEGRASLGFYTTPFDLLSTHPLAVNPNGSSVFTIGWARQPGHFVTTAFSTS